MISCDLIKIKNTYYLDKSDKSLVVAKLSKFNTLAFVQRYIGDNFVDQIEKFDIGVDFSYEKSNTGDKSNKDNTDSTDDASLDDFNDSSFESNDDDFNDPFFNS